MKSEMSLHESAAIEIPMSGIKDHNYHCDWEGERCIISILVFLCVGVCVCV